MHLDAENKIKRTCSLGVPQQAQAAGLRPLAW